jgi:hypothetical protein
MSVVAEEAADQDQHLAAAADHHSTVHQFPLDSSKTASEYQSPPNNIIFHLVSHIQIAPKQEYTLAAYWEAVQAEPVTTAIHTHCP